MAQPLKAETFSIEKIIIATDLLKIKETQLVEVLVRNSSKSDRSLICKLVVTLPSQGPNRHLGYHPLPHWRQRIWRLLLRR